ncbi:MAG: TRAP transporter substrate-binding protein [Hyphomicrobiales bacterium]|nr:TRAP transporter substrate-binding protein [Hyphomicrobiales bacterium]MCP5371325.1 TRAP transporter substrate-binding protein [Hyphomicrobiales bacterium]
MTTKTTRALLGGALALSALAWSLPGQAADVTLRFAHFWPPVAGTHKNLFQAWADKVGQDSAGRIKVEVYPSATLAKPPAQYEAVKDRIADVTATVQGYTANRFPLTQVVELPGVARNAAHGSCIIQSLYDEGLIAGEYTDTRPLFLFTHGPGHIHTSEKQIKVPGDFAGMRIRRPTAVVGKLLEELGAQPVGMPAPQSYQSMQRGVIDGVALPWEGALVFRLNELAKHHTEVGGLYTLSFIVTMNKDVYAGLPADLKKVIDDNSGMAWSKIAATVFDGLDVKGRAAAVKAGHEIVTIEGGIENPAWKPVLAKAAESYLDELEGKGLPARKVYGRALELAKSCN